jgi:hypothetical protein
LSLADGNHVVLGYDLVTDLISAAIQYNDVALRSLETQSAVAKGIAIACADPAQL